MKSRKSVGSRCAKRMLLENRKNGDTGMLTTWHAALGKRCVWYKLSLARGLDGKVQPEKELALGRSDSTFSSRKEIFRIEIFEALGIREIARKNFSDETRRVDFVKNICIIINLKKNSI